MKDVFKSFVFLNILVLLLVLVNCIPNSLIYDNLCESVKYYNDIKDNLSSSPFLNQSDLAADLNELNIIMNVNSHTPFKDALLAPFYREFDNQDYPIMTYRTIVEKKGANYNYNRYWHGYQILWRPLLILFNSKQIMNFMLIVYLLLLCNLLYCLYKSNMKDILVGIILMNIIYIVPNGFASLEYIPVFFVYVIVSLIMLNFSISSVLLFMCSGILVAFTDFWTAETLTLTIPFLIYLKMKYMDNNISILNCILNGISWLLGYCFTFIYKWTLSTVFLKDNYFKMAFDNYSIHKDNFGGLNSIKVCINMLFYNIFSTERTLLIFLIVLGIFLFTLYLIRKIGSEKYIICICIICMIPYINYWILSGHTLVYAIFTYREQLCLFPAIFMLSKCFDKRLIKKGVLRER